ncbi:MAG TPA: transcriptional repressor [Candidatus Saccharimonadales bacterium]
MIKTRSTATSTAVMRVINELGHASNAQILQALESEFPALTATTVHRITTRLHAQGRIAAAPATLQQAFRYDANTVPHDHFNCRGCDGLRDITVDRTLLDSVQEQLGNCKIQGSMVISGICSTCLARSKMSQENSESY